MNRLPGLAQQAVRPARHPRTSPSSSSPSSSTIPPAPPATSNATPPSSSRTARERSTARTPSGSRPSPPATSSASAWSTPSPRCSSSPPTTPTSRTCPRGEANYYDLLGADAFGNFRTLLQDVTLNPMMGQFPLHARQRQGQRHHRSRRELRARGDAAVHHRPLPAQRRWLARSSTPPAIPSPPTPTPMCRVSPQSSPASVGTSPATTPTPPGPTAASMSAPASAKTSCPCRAFPATTPRREKDFLGVTIPRPAQSRSRRRPQDRARHALQSPQPAAFFCKQLIQHLVTSNPSPAYIGHVAAVFKDNGRGVRGDLKAVITAILLDPEARDSATDFANPKYGKVREALLRYTEWARAFTAQSRNGAYGIGSTEDPIWGLGQMTLRSPTVFNWFAPGYVPPGTSIEQAGLVAPEMQMTNVTTVVGYLNYMQDAIGSNANDGSDIFSSYGAELGLAANPDALLDRINLLLMAGEMDSTLHSQILGAVNAIPIPIQRSERHQRRARHPRRNRNLPHHGLARAILDRPVLGVTQELSPCASAPPINSTAPAASSCAPRPWPPWPASTASPFLLELNSLAAMAQGNRLVRLQGPGLRLPAGRQRWPRHRHRHRHRLLLRLHRGALRRARPRLSARRTCCPSRPAPRRAAAPSPSIPLSPACRTSSTPAAPPSSPTPARLSLPPPRRRSRPTPFRCLPRSSPTSIRPPRGRPSPPTAAAPSMSDGAARSPTSSRA